MIILTIRTDKPEAEVALYDNDIVIQSLIWEAHRQLSDTIHTKIADLLNDNQKTWQDINGIVVFKGPGSFTGLRIGISVANALSYGLHIPIIGSSGDDWVNKGIQLLRKSPALSIVVPEYGGEANITAPKK